MTDDLPPEAVENAGGTDAAPVEQLQVWNSEQLLGSKSEAIILHNGKPYRLRRTKQGKLILYK